MKTESKGNCGHPSHPIPCPYSHKTESKHTLRSAFDYYSESGQYKMTEALALFQEAAQNDDEFARLIMKAPLLEECKEVIKMLRDGLCLIHCTAPNKRDEGKHCKACNEATRFLAKLEGE